MGRTYSVYLSTDDEDPEDGDQHVDWVRFICKVVEVGYFNKNELNLLQEHTSWEMKMGEMVFKARLEGCLFMRMDTSAAGETSWNKFVDFVGSHAMSGGDSFYLYVYAALGSDAGGTYMDFFNDEGENVGYMKCRVRSFRFRFDAAKQTAEGSIELEEVWT